MKYNNLYLKYSSLIILGNVKTFATVKAFGTLLQSTNSTPIDFARAYSEFAARNLKKSLGKSILEAVHFDDNLLTRHLTSSKGEIPPKIKEAVEYDLSVLKEISEINAEDLLTFMIKKHTDYKKFIKSLPEFESNPPFAFENCEALIEFYKTKGFGFFAKGTAYYFEDNTPHIAPNPDPISLTELLGYEAQKREIISNTLAFLDCKPANNILLYGDKGTGKSSTVKAVVNEYASKGLKVIEVRINQIHNFPRLYGYIANSPFKFIVMLDDISFNETDSTYTTLKAFIEGGVNSKPDNMIIYATSNRKNIVAQKFSDREGDEVRVRDAMESASSLSDRFGIEVTFFNLDKTDFLSLVTTLAQKADIIDINDEFYLRAERFAITKGSRSPRTAQQFITFCLSEA